MSTRRFTSLDVGRAFGPGAAERLAAVRAAENERWRRARAVGTIGTAIIHLLIFLFFGRTALPPSERFSPAGPPAGDVRAAAGGGSGLTMIEVRPERPQPEEVVIEPVPVPEEVVIEPEPVEEPEVAPDPDPGPTAPSLPGVEAPGPGGEGGPATGPGTATGTGEGAGGTGEEGTSAVVPPRPRGIFIPPSGRPDSARGQEITVWVFVGENGRVDRNTVRLEPPTSDSRYNQRLMQSVAEWVFDPARQNGQPIPAWYPFEVIL